ncbi:MAG: D-glycero-beta-D-manno-heptose 1-phosphate adenylyltransferase [Elusimicrobia bacterium CG_4_10_14_3_um_filter_49_12_50_7]|nr:MAG: D-glycero-beta-D-manno-heptose 1-phosphate adenylyltransferase [Elusimicrobia bacterium CG03_land_8_20_14_0_80_50_18]PIX13949.1 MAG: D-glycero-beta-D-manno-heptose 1-phosphate adenylyltransferase [Elusimicrobia bacterium CG_4_8_14_3_um_filter_50_9]PIY18030.1 MAG: D-glycero-beta-D-manno-heptose 1-phosphate adenylyltransferase [Elusimicrobia bacterium CG_4_10_14_3_um_filter_49_12_50_7]
MICKLSAAAEAASRSRAAGKKVVFTNGCFDIIHSGHVKLLNDAKAFGDILIVGLNESSSVRAIKPGRPVNSFAERAAVLNALKPVDIIFGFKETTPLAAIKKIKPDILVKGGDWKISEIVGAPFVRSRGGKVHTVKLRKNRSTTALIKKIREL